MKSACGVSTSVFHKRLTLMTCSLGSRLQSAKVRPSPSRNFLLDVVTFSVELWSISSGSGAFRYSSKRLNSRSRFFSCTEGSETIRVFFSLCKCKISEKPNLPALFGLFLMKAENFAKMSAPTSKDSLFIGLRWGYLERRIKKKRREALMCILFEKKTCCLCSD